jgi:hypothetical protein
MRRKSVYVIGAGFSAGLGYPLTHDLLVRLWARLDDPLRDGLAKVIKFHHTSFDHKRFTSFPNIELLLSKIAVNLELFDASRVAVGRFKKERLEEIRQGVLSETAVWFHEISESVDPHNSRHEWLAKFRDKVIAENAAIISFNWDLILEKVLFEKSLDGQSYGLSAASGSGPILLKPHGSLNWFEESQAKYIASDRRIQIFGKGKESVHAFLRYREPISKREREYTPLIIPPIYLKNFGKPIFQALWQKTMSCLSTAEKVTFLGYSMPEADLHAQFILRCGFYNQTQGQLKKGGGRTDSTGAAKVTIVNPDQGAARRIEAVLGRHAKCKWLPKPVAQWVSEDC